MYPLNEYGNRDSRNNGNNNTRNSNANQPADVNHIVGDRYNKSEFQYDKLAMNSVDSVKLRVSNQIENLDSSPKYGIEMA
mgnify:CR=1 FL=1|jgi:hypothetical protein